MMADEKTAAQSGEQAAPKPGRKKTVMLGGIFLGLMAVEAIVVFILVKHFTGGPSTAQAAPLPGTVMNEGTKQPELVELEVAKIRAQNERSQRQMVYSIEVVVTATEDNEEKLNEILQRRKAAIQDRLTQVVRGAEPDRFSEPDLRTLRKQIQTELGAVVGDEKLIHEVLIPSIVSSEI